MFGASFPFNPDWLQITSKPLYLLICVFATMLHLCLFLFFILFVRVYRIEFQVKFYLGLSLLITFRLFFFFSFTLNHVTAILSILCFFSLILWYIFELQICVQLKPQISLNRNTSGTRNLPHEFSYILFFHFIFLLIVMIRNENMILAKNERVCIYKLIWASTEKKKWKKVNRNELHFIN